MPRPGRSRLAPPRVVIPLAVLLCACLASVGANWTDAETIAGADFIAHCWGTEELLAAVLIEGLVARRTFGWSWAGALLVGLLVNGLAVIIGPFLTAPGLYIVETHYSAWFGVAANSRSGWLLATFSVAAMSTILKWGPVTILTAILGLHTKRWAWRTIGWMFVANLISVSCVVAQVMLVEAGTSDLA